MYKNNQQMAHTSYQCSFCQKEYDQAKFLTEGPGNIFICRDCVDLYRRHIEERMEDADDVTKIIQVCRSCGTHAPSSHRYCFNCGIKIV